MNFITEIMTTKAELEKAYSYFNQGLKHIDEGLKKVDVLLIYLKAQEDYKIANFLEDMNNGVLVHPEREEIEKAAALLHNVDLKLNNSKNGISLFTKKEVDEMPKLKEGRYRYNNGVHEIRFRRYGYNVSFSSKVKKTAKAKFKLFIISLNEKIKCREIAGGLLFEEWAKRYMYEIKQPTIKPESFKSYEGAYRNHILPELQGKYMKDIKQIDIQMLFNKMLEKNVLRVAEYAKTLLTGIFDTALANKIISETPMQCLIIPKHTRKHGKALTLVEEQKLVTEIKGRKYELACLLMLYMGGRKVEVLQLDESSFDFENNLIKCHNAKVKGIQREITYRNIPINPMLKKALEPLKNKISELKTVSTLELTKFFKKILPNHNLHELRHTFITRAREMGIDRDIVSLWAGHSSGGNVTNYIYTHFSMEKQQEAAKKFNYQFPNSFPKN